ncbi:MAG: exo-alpha-sialidase [Clostridia bacterium]|nr:exo-alpha-sialidase [Clostridia bacterium]
MKNHTWVMVLCLLIAFVTVLTACGGGGDDNGDATTARPKKTTERTEATTAATTAPMVTVSDLIPQINEADQNLILSRPMEGIEVEIYNGVTYNLHYLGWPTVCKGDGETLYAVASLRLEHIDPFGTTVFMESHDSGKTWTKPRVIVDSAHDERDSGIVYMGNGRMLVSYFTPDVQRYIDGDYSYWQGRGDITEEQKKAVLERYETLSLTEKQGGSYVVYSDDYGKTWGDPIQVPVSSPHGPTLGIDGKTLYYFGYPNKSAAAGFSFDTTKLHVITSTNYGKSWKHLCEVEKPTGLSSYEPHLIQLSDGSFVAAVRSDTDKTNTATRGMAVYTATSKDGRTWTPMKRASRDMLGGPPHLMQMDNGVVVLTYGYREGECGSRARLSYDGGQTWGEEIVLAISALPDSTDCGYPSTVQLADGTLFTIYYQEYAPKDYFCSILYTKWSLVEADAQ